MKKLPDFDQHVIAKNYDLTDDEEDSDDVGNAYSEISMSQMTKQMKMISITL